MKSSLVCDITPRTRIPVNVNRRFRRKECLHLQSLNVRQRRNQHETGSKLYVSPKRRLTFACLHDFIFQKIFLAMRMTCSLEKSTSYHRTLWPYIPVDKISIVTAMSSQIQYRVFENRVLEEIFGLKSGEVAGGWR
jgi:hypothetical protein